jgi:undecaprenyl-diphosphatase
MDIIYQIKAFILGIVEGLTEFLPISSTGHLIIAGDILNFDGPEVNTFSIAIQAGAIFAVCWFYRVKLWNILVHLFEHGKDQRLAINIVVAFIPAAILGVIFADMIEELLFNAVTVAIALVVGGLIIFWIENLHAKRTYAPRVQTMDDMTIKDAFLVGCMQCIAMIPGTSRSGSTIIGGLVLGLSRKAATEFSFFLAIPTIFGATVYSLAKIFLKVSAEHSFIWTTNMTLGFTIGFIVSFISALVVIKWLLGYVSSNDFKPFGWYRIIFGIIILGTHYSGLVQW